MKKILKLIFEKIINIIAGLAFFAQLILIIQIGELLLKNQELGMLILYYIGCDFICYLRTGDSLTKTIILMVFKNEQKTESQNNKNN